MDNVKTAIISIGNEILLGKTINTNLAYLASELALLGLPVDHCVIIHDDKQEIAENIQALWNKFDVVVSTGGLGPTKDDITKEAITRVFGKPLVFEQDIWIEVQEKFSRRGLPVPQINRSQAMIPAGFTALSNARGTAPGLYFSGGGRSFFALPGVPVEMKFIFETHIKDILRKKHRTKPVSQVTFHTWNTTESALAERLEEFVLPEGVSLAWLPQTGRVDLRVYGTDEAKVIQSKDQLSALILDAVWGIDEDTPASALQNAMIDNGLALSVAESCTGGMLQQMITAVPGSSRYFKGGLVAYSNEMKERLLGVDPATIAKYGTVSEEVAREMASGCLIQSGADYAIALTGIAGPDGATGNKPVGLVCFGIASTDDALSLSLVFTGDREQIRHKASEYALLTLKHICNGCKPEQ
ncbi:MAG: CinA family nicotinamide mononucleotide deamidase-related protein [Candidatus Cloacimonetes bacterium]|nr:CinA family nicotinamide mononucleotide deamidase-related protein [Candidatus Cloacimonadota bacterium]